MHLKVASRVQVHPDPLKQRMRDLAPFLPARRKPEAVHVVEQCGNAIEQGRRNITISTITRIAAALDVSIAALFEGDA